MKPRNKTVHVALMDCHTLPAAPGLGERLRSLRFKENLSGRQLATKIGCTNTAVSFWERGRSVPSLDAAQALSDLFGVSIDYLARGHEFGAQP